MLDVACCFQDWPGVFLGKKHSEMSYYCILHRGNTNRREVKEAKMEFIGRKTQIKLVMRKETKNKMCDV